MEFASIKQKMYNLNVLNPQEEKCLDSKNINPFDEEVIDNILSNLAVPVEKRGGYVPLRQNMPCLRAGVDVSNNGSGRKN